MPSVGHSKCFSSLFGLSKSKAPRIRYRILRDDVATGTEVRISMLRSFLVDLLDVLIELSLGFLLHKSLELTLARC